MHELTAAMEAFFEATIRPKIDTKIDGYRKKIEAAQQAEYPDEQAIEKLRHSYNETLQQQSIQGWLAAQLEGNVSRFALTTHPPTFSDPSSKGVAIDASDQTTGDTTPFIGTHSAVGVEADTLCGSAAMPLTSFLKVSDGRTRVIDAIQQDDWSIFSPFAASEAQAQQWVRKIAEALNESRTVDSGLAQLFFPVGEGSYHLVVPLFPSSMYQRIHQRLIDSRFGEVNVERRRSMRAGVSDDGPARSIPDTAALAPIGSQPQNVSQFNAARRGLVHLFSAAPPPKKEGVTPPLEGVDAFWRQFSRIGGGSRRIRYLARYLRARHWQNNRELRQHRDEVVGDLVSDLLQLAAHIQNLEDWAGWSHNSDIPYHEKLWLDPRRGDFDPGFAADRAAGQWIDKVRDAFSQFLNRRLAFANEYFDDVGEEEAAHWGSIFEQYIQEIEA